VGDERRSFPGADTKQQLPACHQQLVAQLERLRMISVLSRL
jgi:hypothetical protein